MSQVEKTIPSVCGHYRVDIVRRSKGEFQVDLLRWTEEWVPGYGKVAEFWERVSKMTTIADTMERAEALAREEFRTVGTSGKELTGR